VLSYLFYIVAVALAAGSFGYALGVGLMGLIGIDFGLLVWIVGVAAGIALAAVTILLNLQKWVIILITSFGGAGIIVGTILAALGKLDTGALAVNPVRQALADSPLWLIIFLVIGILGVVGQVRTTQGFELDPEQRPY
jgi:hypothetical protein